VCDYSAGDRMEQSSTRSFPA